MFFKNSILAIVFVFVFFNLKPSEASVLFHPQSMEEVKSLNDVEPMESLSVIGGEVAWANYELIRHDFTHLKKASDSEIDSWILKNFSSMSVEQLKLNPAPQSPFLIKPDSKTTTYRQPNQGRGDLAIAYDDKGLEVGLVDLKGTGVTKRRRIVRNRLWELYKRNRFTQEQFEKRGSVNGLMALSDSILETAAAQALARIFENQKVDLPTAVIEHYFIIRLPFDILRGSSPGAAASIIGRQAHVGRVWIGTNPFHEISNIKQTDFFGSYTDTGTTRIRLPGTPEYLSGRRGHSLALQREAVEDVINAHTAGDKKAVQLFIDGTVNELAPRTPQRMSPQRPEKLSTQNAVDLISRWIVKDPTRFSRFSETLIQLQAIGRKDLLQSSDVQRVILTLLDTPWSTLESSLFSGENEQRRKSVRRFGLALLPSLSDSKRAKAIQRYSQDRRDLVELARVMVDLNPQENAFLLSQIQKDSELINIYAHELRKRMVHRNAKQNPGTSEHWESYWKALRAVAPEAKLYQHDEKSFPLSCKNFFRKNSF